MISRVATVKAILSLTEIMNMSTYVVGGTVRDLMLGRQATDLDLLVFGDVWRLAAELARAFGGSWFALDEPNLTVSVHLPKPEHLRIDLVGAGRRSLVENLNDRDFTINAMALHLADYQDYLTDAGSRADLNSLIYDPLHGQKDLQDHRIRVVQQDAFLRDPLRLLRAIRFAATLNFAIEAETLKIIEKQAGYLNQVAMERIRDEFFYLLALDHSVQWIEQLDRLKLLEIFLPPVRQMNGAEQNAYHTLDVWQHSLSTLNILESKPWLGLFAPNIETELEHYLMEELPGNYSRWQLLKLGALLHDVGKPFVKVKTVGSRPVFHGHEQESARIIRELAINLKLAHREQQYLRNLVTQHMRPIFLFRDKQRTSRAEYRFFLDAGNETASVLILTLADRQAGRPPEILAMHEEYRGYIQTLMHKYILEFLQNQKHPLLSGFELIQAYGLRSSPFIGQLLNSVEEARMQGEIRTKEEAFAFVEKRFRIGKR